MSHILLKAKITTCLKGVTVHSYCIFDDLLDLISSRYFPPNTSYLCDCFNSHLLVLSVNYKLLYKAEPVQFLRLEAYIRSNALVLVGKLQIFNR